MSMTRRSGSWFEHALRRTRWQPQRQVVALGALGFFIALILGGLYLSQVASEVSTRDSLTELLELRDDLEQQNEQLRVEIARFQAVSQLQAKAEVLGFRLAQPGEIEYLPVEGYNPVLPDTVAPIVVEEEDAPVYDETFAGWLEQQWDSFQRSIRDLVGGG